MKRSSEPYTNILIVEDNPLDVVLLRHAFKEQTEWQTKLAVVVDGQEAIDYLTHPEGNLTDLVILDLNLPKLDGEEVLKAIRQSDELHSLPVIIFSSSPEDVVRSRTDHVRVTPDCCVTKPIGHDEYSTLTQKFWRCYTDAISGKEND
jgi:CheY-like chemotaxis protein